MPTPRLPTPGQDDGTWGDILNTFLQVEHNSDGSLKIRTDGSVAPLVSGKVPSVTVPDPQIGRALVFADQFASLDRTRWNVRTDSQANHYGYNTPGNVTIQPDGLHITAPGHEGCVGRSPNHRTGHHRNLQPAIR